MDWLADMIMLAFCVVVITLAFILVVTNPAYNIAIVVFAMMLFSLFGAGVIAAIRSSR